MKYLKNNTIGNRGAHMIKKLFSYRAPQNLIVTINLIGLFLVSLYNQSFNKTTIGMAIAMVLIIYLSNFILSKISSGDHYIFLIISMLMSIGIIMLYRINPEIGAKQIIWFMIGIITLFISYFIIKSIKKWSQWTLLYVILSFILFLSTLIFGRNIKGATNWIRIGSFGFQPAEVIKILFVFSLASYYVNRDQFENKYILAGISYANIAFLFLQKDLGSALIFFAIYVAILYVYEKDRKFILMNIGAACVIGIISVFVFNHVRVRVETWLNPWKTISGNGYQITQSLFAIASGGFLGTGIGRGYPKLIPEVHNDFIFSSICEEMGILTGIAIIMLYLIFIYRGIKISLEQQNPFYKIVALGITVSIGFQAFIILGGVIKMIPLTGVTLPFLSYGGSSLVTSFASVGILQASSEVFEEEWNEKKEDQDEKREINK